MYSKKQILKICELKCTEEDVCLNQHSIRYDRNYPFEKYYNINSIVGAIEKYISKEWDDKTLAGWACLYMWIICGGYSYGVKENFNTLEKFLVDVICWELDSLSFFEDFWLEEEGIEYIYNTIQRYKNLDKLWNTRNDWACLYSTVDYYTKLNDEQYVLLFNIETREYIIILSDHLKNGYSDEYVKFVDKNKFVELVKQLDEEGFKMLNYDEKWYNESLNEQNEDF